MKWIIVDHDHFSLGGIEGKPFLHFVVTFPCVRILLEFRCALQTLNHMVYFNFLPWQIFSQKSSMSS
jgi:hypothetical protein